MSAITATGSTKASTASSSASGATSSTPAGIGSGGSSLASASNPSSQAGSQSIDALFADAKQATSTSEAAQLMDKGIQALGKAAASSRT